MILSWIDTHPGLLGQGSSREELIEAGAGFIPYVVDDYEVLPEDEFWAVVTEAAIKKKGEEGNIPNALMAETLLNLRNKKPDTRGGEVNPHPLVRLAEQDAPNEPE